MAEPPGPKPYGARWRPVADLPADAEGWGSRGYREALEEWGAVRREMEDRKTNRYLLDIRRKERARAFAIETGQIEGLYLLRRGVTERLVTEGFESVRGANNVAGELDDDTLRGLLEDQQETLEIVCGMAKRGAPLSHTTIKGLHAILTRRQETAVGIHGLTGERVEIPLRKGDYKIRPNNPRRRDGHVHEYCSPEQVDSEMDAFLAFHRSHADRELPTEVEAAWIHHEFVRIHPFQDGNGRMSRLLVAYVFARNEELIPLITATGRGHYIEMLEIADDGDLRPFVKYLADLAMLNTHYVAVLGQQILKGRDRLRHGNGGVTANGKYYPPPEEPSVRLTGRPESGPSRAQGSGPTGHTP